MKTIINLTENLNAKNGDVLVYDKKSDTWEVQTKAYFLRGVTSQIAELKTENENLKEQVQKLAKIVKEIVK